MSIIFGIKKKKKNILSSLSFVLTLSSALILFLWISTVFSIFQHAPLNINSYHFSCLKAWLLAQASLQGPSMVYIVQKATQESSQFILISQTPLSGSDNDGLDASLSLHGLQQESGPILWTTHPALRKLNSKSCSNSGINCFQHFSMYLTRTVYGSQVILLLMSIHTCTSATLSSFLFPSYPMTSISFLESRFQIAISPFVTHI